MTEAESADKPAWRRRMAAFRDAIPAAERAVRSRALCAAVEQALLLPLRRKLGRPLTVCVYGAFRSEADPWPLAQACLSQGDTVAAPLIQGRQLAWRIVRREEDWRPGRWDVPEPDPARTAPLPTDTAPDAVLVPGLAFDRYGGRLGYGGGYYDRMYAEERRCGHDGILWVGFAFAIQITDGRLPREAHDLKLDVLATDEGLTRWNGGTDDGGRAGNEDGHADAFQ